MLGWFKKKFSKPEEEANQIRSVDDSLQNIEADEPTPEAFAETSHSATGQDLSLPEDQLCPAPSSTTDSQETEEKVPAPLGKTRTRTAEHVDGLPQEDVGKSEESLAHSEAIPAKTSDAEGTRHKRSRLARLSERLGKTKESFTYQIDALFLGKREIDTDLLDNLEEILITADLGVPATQEILEHARKKVKRQELSDPESLKKSLKKKIKEFIISNEQDACLVMPDKGPFVIMVIGVNGVGKTTTIGKIANKFIKADNSVLLVAADTFRAAAVSQLQIWGERNSVEVVAHKEGADPSSVVFDAMDIAKTKDYDVVLVDTAGRLHTKTNLMEELKKIKRVMAKQLRGAPHEVMLVLDATTGQNAISQAKLFDAAVDITGITLTKLDGTSKGGIVANICREMKVPIRFIGIGEQMDDLRDFDADDFVDALFQSRDKTSTS